MGALHDGHLALVRAAREQSVAVAASVFVNPLQFAPHEDLERYPRDPQGDRRKLAEAGVDVLFAPPVAAIYPEGFATSVDVGDMATTFEGAARPSHFRGVSTVVAKLINIVKPSTIYLGQKDAQQTAVLRRMIEDLAFETRVEIVATQREPDGLAMSSRNVYLDARQREAAPTLHRALETMRDALSRGATKEQAVAEASRVLSPLAQLDYLDLVDERSFTPVDTLRSPCFIIGAARFGQTRLLDNLRM